MLRMCRELDMVEVSTFFIPDIILSTSSAHTTVAVGSVSVRAGVDGGACGGEVLAPPLRHQDHDCHDHS